MEWNCTRQSSGLSVGASETADSGNAQLLLTLVCRRQNDALAKHRAQAEVIKNSQDTQAQAGDKHLIRP